MGSYISKQKTSIIYNEINPLEFHLKLSSRQSFFTVCSSFLQGGEFYCGVE
jgi:hypothetical protein